jgi:transcriptional regulator with XRE-family HTH domain
MEHDWNARTTKRVGAAIAEARKRRGGMTAQALADATAEVGSGIDRSVIAKIEKGLRQSVSVAELVVIARALRVPPALLLYPVGESDEVEFLPGVVASPWDALRWFCGDRRIPLDNFEPKGEVDPATGLAEWYHDPEAGWEESAAPVMLWRQHSDQVAEWFDAPSVVRRMGLDGQEERAERARLRGRAEEALKQTRTTMRMRGLKPPRLPEELADLDD